MKCKKCGHVTRSINAMRKHYWKKHPGAMKRKLKKAPRGRSSEEVLTTINGYDIVKRKR